MDKSELTELQKEAINVIEKNNSVYQNELSEIIDCSKGYVSQLAIKLSENNFIKREKDNAGKYVLKPVKKDPKDLDFSLLLAGNEISPFIRDDDVDIKGDRFTNWLMNLMYEE